MTINLKNVKKIATPLGLLVGLGVLFFLIFYFSQPSPAVAPVVEAPVFENSQSVVASSSEAATTTDNLNLKLGFALPIADASSRVTKKPFGIHVSPNNSPVSPEKFTGYHTGVDFETTPQEQDLDVPVYAICDGPLILRRTATGYGGVAVQACQLDGEAITVVYGHLKLSSIKPALNDQLKSGEQLGILGKGYSAETSGERKHLHLGIHKGAALNLLGYVSKKTDLDGWLDFLALTK